MRVDNLNDYREFVRKRMAPNSPQTNHMGFAIGLMAEAGEFMEEVIAAKLLAVSAGKYGDLVKKEELHARPNSPEHQDKKKKELGDVLWYWMACCIVEGFSAWDVLASNVEKLEARANDAAYAAKNPNVPTNVKTFGPGTAERLLPLQLAMKTAPSTDVGAGFVECQICKRVRPLGEPGCCYVDGTSKAQ